MFISIQEGVRKWCFGASAITGRGPGAAAQPIMKRLAADANTCEDLLGDLWRLSPGVTASDHRVSKPQTNY
jgi:hypothetical protein